MKRKTYKRKTAGGWLKLAHWVEMTVPESPNGPESTTRRLFLDETGFLQLGLVGDDNFIGIIEDYVYYQDVAAILPMSTRAKNQLYKLLRTPL